MKATNLASRNLTAGVHSRRAPLLADSVFGMLIFVAIEVMFFTALISAFVIIRPALSRGLHRWVCACQWWQRQRTRLSCF
jgi:heme/copper-type cytochrome/quinol oxidase subunit 3